MAFYDEAAATAVEMIEEFGQAVVIAIRSSTYNPETGEDVSSSTSQTGSGVALNHKASDVDGDLVRVGDKKLLLSSVDEDGLSITTPVMDQTTVTLADGSVWTVKGVSTLKPANTVVMHTLNLRGAG